MNVDICMKNYIVRNIISHSLKVPIEPSKPASPLLLGKIILKMSSQLLESLQVL